MKTISRASVPKMSDDVANLVKMGVYSLFEASTDKPYKYLLYVPGNRCCAGHSSLQEDQFYTMDETGNLLIHSADINDVKKATIAVLIA